MRKKIFVIIPICIIAIIGGVVWFIASQNKPNNSNSSNKHQTVVKPDTKQTKNILKISAMGDMLAHDTININATTETSYNYVHYFQNVSKLYAGSDVVFCNQEGLSSGETYGISGYPTFNAPKEFARDLSKTGCNMINLANNHMGDKGTAAINETVDLWSSLNPLAFAGANKTTDEQNTVRYFTKNGIKVAFLAFADFNNNKSTPSYAVNIYHDDTLLRNLITEARKNADLLIVSMHWGTEDSNAVNINQTTTAQELNDLGVDIIIGTGPHVLQKADILTSSTGQKTVVWYSLGNFLSSQLNISELIGGVAHMTATKENNKITISELSFDPTYMHYEWTAAQAANNDLLSRRNVMIYPLNEAATPLSKSLLNTTVSAQENYVADTIGTLVKINN